ncbi:cell wall protein [Diaporthe amygdali]|uniref:cell wall protein n=1 Tax=Phomopsis amygdali TaxID=1214568 RepID=UPI0022FDD348|nr:cell wall protein [Diaporthe amygdali]KAJ0119544.1 cell wall protein [Diaporthe amygdali]
MFLTKCLLLAAASYNVLGATGTEHMRRDLGSIQASLGGVNTALASLDSAIINNAASPKVLISSMNVLQTIQQATTSINASQPLSLADTSNLKATTDSLVSNVNVTITDLINQKPVFDALNLEKVVLIQVQNIQGAALALASTLANKVDPAASSLAVDGIYDLTTALQRGVMVFEGNTAAASTAPQPAPAAPPPAASQAAPPPAAPQAAPPPSIAPPPSPPPSNSQPPSPLPSNPPSSSPPKGSIGPGPYTMMMPIPGTFEAGVTCICMCPPVTACGSS